MHGIPSLQGYRRFLTLWDGELPFINLLKEKITLTENKPKFHIHYNLAECVAALIGGWNMALIATNRQHQSSISECKVTIINLE
jgi:hypothetical protein